MRWNQRSRPSSFRRNHGQPGVVYVLGNAGLRSGWWKIGCSTRSGAARAAELNKEAGTGTPGLFHCVFEQRTLDCGLAEQRVFVELSGARKGKRGQEYFEVELDRAREVIRHVCSLVDGERKPTPLPTPAPARPPSTLPAHKPPVVQPVAKANPHPAPSPVPEPVFAGRPERFCGHCRRLVLPKSRFRWLAKCPMCGNAL